MYDGSLLIGEEIRTVSDNALVAYIYYLYDPNGTAYGYLYKASGGSSVFLYYRRNLQGDITGILTSAGVELVSYRYSPFGECIGVSYASNITAFQRTAVDANPLRYRGYYYLPWLLLRCGNGAVLSAIPLL